MVRRRVSGHGLHGPAHIDAEVLSVLARLHRAGELRADDVDEMLRKLAAAPLERHPMTGLSIGAWSRRDRLRLVDAIYVELAESLEFPLITTDTKLHAEPSVEVVGT
ncbi:MAG TPA: type II toxin-antitoxin system VapC family toxin [Acidimicrobiales bacterium]|nr:type II toxin-antitoxin system VapC family toxin [Acidimicrobiales bacterium]